MADHKRRAADLFVNYFKAVADKAGMKWDNDYSVEISEAVDEIIAAAVEAVSEDIDRLQEQIDIPDWRNRR